VKLKIIFLVCVLSTNLALAAAQSKGAPSKADQVLERMGALGKDFHSFQADFTQRNYVAVLKEFDEPESGAFTFARAKDGSALLRQEFKSPSHKTLTIKGGEATLYQPSLNQATVYSLGKNRDKAEFLALGIGQSPGKMRETFDISYQGEEKVDNIPCSVLVLKPKSSSAAAFFSVITLWISNTDNLPIQQKLQEPNGNYLLNLFKGGKLNVRVSETDFDQRLPKGVDIQRIK